LGPSSSVRRNAGTAHSSHHRRICAGSAAPQPMPPGTSHRRNAPPQLTAAVWYSSSESAPSMRTPPSSLNCTGLHGLHGVYAMQFSAAEESADANPKENSPRALRPSMLSTTDSADGRGLMPKEPRVVESAQGFRRLPLHRWQGQATPACIGFGFRRDDARGPRNSGEPAAHDGPGMVGKHERAAAPQFRHVARPNAGNHRHADLGAKPRLTARPSY
jgi:hypothetical protein